MSIYVKTNNSPFMNKTISKAIITRSRLRNKFIKNPTPETKANYTKYRNYCTGLIKMENKSYYNNFDIKLITDNIKFRKSVKPLFSDKHFSGNKITLAGEEIISNDHDIAESFNSYFTKVVENLDIDMSLNSIIFRILWKNSKITSILKINENYKIEEGFNFSPVDESKIGSLNKKKANYLQ